MVAHCRRTGRPHCLFDTSFWASQYGGSLTQHVLAASFPWRIISMCTCRFKKAKPVFQKQLLKDAVDASVYTKERKKSSENEEFDELFEWVPDVTHFVHP